MKWIGKMIWNLSEDGIIPPLGRFAPFVFDMMLGFKERKRINKRDEIE
jgi:hypothetical protein